MKTKRTADAIIRLMDDKNMTAIVALIGVVTLGLLAEKTVSSYTYEAVGANA